MTDGEQTDALAAIVRKPRGDIAVETLKAEGVYDDSRRIVEHDDGTLAIPITDPPRMDVLRVIRQTDPAYRPRDLSTLLAERGWSPAEREHAPNSWAVLGSVILVTVPSDCPDEQELGEALLELHGNAETVLAREGIAGQRRQPNRRVIAGTGVTETVHTEHGIKYAMDLATVMFSPGNKHERARMAALVGANEDPPAATVETVPDQVPQLHQPPTGETVFDMFAGIGYFTLPMAIAGGTVTAAEINPESFRYLIKNAALNDVSDRIQPYLADCREVTADADRVVMGHYDAPEYLETAFAAVRPGGVIHFHALVPQPEQWDRPDTTITSAATDAARDVTIVQRRRIKTFSEGVDHVVLDVRVN